MSEVEVKSEKKEDAPKTVRMKFLRDGWWNFDLKYEAGKEYDVPVEKADRWLRRGAVYVDKKETVMEKTKTKIEEVVDKVVGAVDKVIHPGAKTEVETEDQKADTVKVQSKRGPKPKTV